MKTTELQKIYTASTNQVAVKQRWSQGSPIGPNDHGMSALAKMLVGHKLTLEPVDPAEQAIEVNATPETSETDKQGSGSRSRTSGRAMMPSM